MLGFEAKDIVSPTNSISNVNAIVLVFKLPPG